MVPADSRRIPRVPRYSGYRYATLLLRAGGCHPLRPGFPARSRSQKHVQRRGPTTPRMRRHNRGLGSSPVARHYWGNHCLFSFPGGTKMFQFPPFASTHMCGWQRFTLPGCPIRKSADQRSFAPTRGLSQLITSFIASVSQGIRHAPFLTFASDCPHGTSKCRGSSYFSFLFEPASSRQAAVLLVSECQRSVSGTCLTEWRITDSNR